MDTSTRNRAVIVERHRNPLEAVVGVDHFASRSDGGLPDLTEGYQIWRRSVAHGGLPLGLPMLSSPSESRPLPLLAGVLIPPRIVAADSFFFPSILAEK
ncbi:hypothetical protein TIFTF001_019516 [Ficus carica]|uniref:Uncharacterized protein n=1 Tax=Ficus carica TaxID=3494 RepID=A0AA88AT15_FICCA|nr:hypothetical protein TIFTF001_019516 [Ficus carica]